MKIKFFSFYSMFFLIFSLFQIGCAYAASYGTFTLTNTITQADCSSTLVNQNYSKRWNAKKNKYTINGHVYCKYRIAFMHDGFVDVDNGQEQNYVNAPGVFAQIVFCVAIAGSHDHCTYLGYAYPTGAGHAKLSLQMPSCTYTANNVGGDVTPVNCTTESVAKNVKFVPYNGNNANPSDNEIPAYTPYTPPP